MEHIFIANPVAGKKGAVEGYLQNFVAACAQRGLPHSFHITQYPGHGRLLAQAAQAAGQHACLYAVGGDGTLNEVIAGAAGAPHLSVAAIPCGSGNDFVRSFGPVEAFLDPAWLEDGEELVVDLMQTHQGIAAGICSAGVDAAVAYSITKYRRLPFCGGEMAYRLSILENLAKPLGHTLTVTLDDAPPITGHYLMVTVANGAFYGGGFCAAPFARMDDGLLEVLLVPKMHLPQIARVLPAYQKGRHFGEDGQLRPSFEKYIIHHRARRVSITGDKVFIINQDGECMPMQKMQVEVLPSALRLRLPTALARAYTAGVATKTAAL